MTSWITLLSLTALLSLGLSQFGLPRYRRAMQVSATVSALLCAGLLAGPPFDSIAGGFILAAVLAFALWAYFNSQA